MRLTRRGLFGFAGVAGPMLVAGPVTAGEGPESGRRIFDLSGPMPRSRSVSPENPTGDAGSGGQAASSLGKGRKGRPAIAVKPGEEVVLCDISGSGILHRFWATMNLREPINYRAAVIRAYWDGALHPAVACPMGDFFGFSHGRAQRLQTLVHTSHPNWGTTVSLPMPFASRAKITLTNDGDKPIRFFYSIDYTLEDIGAETPGRLHCAFVRENPTTLGKDFVLLDRKGNPGRLIGAVIGVRHHNDGNWWGEGEFKAYLDGDDVFPTICGTGTEDYAGFGWGLQEDIGLYTGCLLNRGAFSTIYRWHLDAPLYWRQACKISFQQIGLDDSNAKMVERQDDWTAAVFWYEPMSAAPLPLMPNVQARTANLWDGAS